MSSREEKVSGETPRTTFRIPAATLGQLDSLVESFAAESGRPENRTTVLLQLIHREAVKRAKNGGKK